MSFFNARLLLVTFSVVAFSQQFNTLRGTLVSSGDPVDGYIAELYNLTNHTVIERCPVSPAGHFDFRNVDRGVVQVRITTMDGSLVTSGTVDALRTAAPLEIRLPKQHRETAVSGVVSAASLSHRPPRKALDAFRKAMKPTGGNDDARAAEGLRKAIEIDPQFAEAHGNLGVLYMRASQFEAAASEFETVLQLGAHGAKDYCNYAAAAMSLHRSAEAETSVRRALAVDSRHPQSNYILGRILALDPARSEQAAKYLALAAPDVPNANLYLVNLYVRAGRRQSAIEALQAFGRSSPGNREKAEEMIRRLKVP